MGKVANLYFYRDSNQNEIDLLIDNCTELTAVEIKSSSTYSSAQFKNINKISKVVAKVTKEYLVFSGEKKTFSNNRFAIGFEQIKSMS